MLCFGLKLNGLPVGGETEGVLKARAASGSKKMLEKSLQKEIKIASSDTRFTQVMQRSLLKTYIIITQSFTER